MKKFIITAWQEIIVVSRDRQALALLFLMPMLLIFFLSFALTDVYHDKIGRKLILEVHYSESPENRKILDPLLKRLGDFQYQVIENQVAKRWHARINFPADLNQTLLALRKGKAPEEAIAVEFEAALDRGYQHLIKNHLVIVLQNFLIEQVGNNLKKALRGVDSPATQELTSLSQFVSLTEVIREKKNQIVVPNPIQQTVPGWALFAMFFIVIPISNSLVRDRQNGILTRLLTYPGSRTVLLLGKLFPFLLINIFQFGLMLAVGIWILPAVSGASFSLGPLNASLGFSLFSITLAASLAATSYGLAVATWAKTNERASAFGATSVIILSILGGVMVPHFIMPEVMQKAAIFSPLYWGLEGYLDVFLRQAAIELIWPKIAVLLGFSAACLVIAGLKVRALGTS